MDPRQEIIAPALAIRKAGYAEPTRDYKKELRDALREEAAAETRRTVVK